MVGALLFGGGTLAGCADDAGMPPRGDTERLGRSAHAIATPGWIGTWGVAPQSGGYAFAAKTTLRQVVHASIGGPSLRLQLSNVFGTQAITIADVHVAKPTDDSGWTIDRTTDKQVSFGGSASVTIPAGQAVASDAVDYAVTALTDIAVDFYLPDATGPSTYHQLASQDNYWYVGGDVATNANMPSGWAGMWNYYFLTGVDIQHSAATGAIVTLGASITDGYTTANDANQRWPDDLAARIQHAGLNVGVLNEGISGNDLLVDGPGSESALHRFARDVTDQSGATWVVMSDDPINDICGGNTNGASLVAGLQQIVEDAHAAGLKIICSTLTPFGGYGAWSSDGETARAQVNSFVRGSGCDAVLDQDTATHDPNNPTAFLAAYDSGDHLHPNAAGDRAGLVLRVRRGGAAERSRVASNSRCDAMWTAQANEDQSSRRV